MMNTTEQQGERVQHPWLMLVRGATIGLIGLLLFSFTGVSHTAISYGIGASLLMSGLCAVWFGTANRNTQAMVPWLIAGGLLDIATIMMPRSADDSLGLTGLLPVLMGGLLIEMVLKLRGKTTGTVRNKPVISTHYRV